MESSFSPQKDSLVSSFLEIAVGQTTDTALQFLKATNWHLEEAIQLFYVGNEGGGAPPSTSSGGGAPPSTSSGADAPVAESPWSNENTVANESIVQATTEDEVRAPLPVRREVLYDDAAFFRNNPSAVVAFRNFAQESRRADVWENDQGNASTASSSHDLASLYRPPFALMHQGSFDKAKVDASLEDKWLLVNLQSAEEFSSHMLNRDTWSNEAVAQTIRSNFIFWQVYHDTSEGKKVCTYYNLYSMPAILVIDPITGQKMHAWSGMVQPDSLLEDLLPYMDRGPKEHHVALPYKRHRESDTSKSSPPPDEDDEICIAVVASLKETKDTIVAKDSEEPKKEEEEVAAKSSTNTPSYPPLPEEPKANKDLSCRVGIRLPDGRRIQRHFLLTDSTELLWSFCSSQLEEAQNRLFSFAQAIPGSSKSIKYEDKLNFKESGLANSMITLTWD